MTEALQARSTSMAIVHDWCPSYRGGERVLAELCKLTDAPDVFTLFDFLPCDVKEAHFASATFHTSIVNRLPWVERYYRALFFLCPFLIEQFDVTGYDVVMSSSAAFARGVITRPDQPHLCYVHSPMRYAWDEQFSYLAQGRLGFGPKGLLYRAMLHHLRTWDTRTAHGPDLLLANSHFVKARIERIYGRKAEVVAPPVSLDELTVETEKDDYYVSASFLAPYKRIDLVVQAFNSMPSKRLIVVGEGQQANALRAMAGPNVVFTGYLPRLAFVAMLAKARALVFAGCEDFGITLAEAQGCGTPVIAFERGGANDIVRPLGRSRRPTGILFRRQTAEAVCEAVRDFERDAGEITPAACRANAERFSTTIFRHAVSEAMGRAIEMKSRQLHLGRTWD
ncbi:glycosyltransferase [Lichenihabitans sp. Uapishka_5]|uniref:glycosyltransferase n=1 Tax=Lichenihabitans sp. Uapishka_5 TaxID=3037302 RepID=UPI0029E806CE|nr:glycosyltransferase [Lichenihabitans sp. Uapishka_5]MDX7950263.1 glycosyltransferase [Lichenihabitans sp. Uapishka_5]